MPNNQAGIQSVCSFVLLILCLGGCGPSDEDEDTAGSGSTQQALTVLHIADKKVDIEVLTESATRLSLYVGDKKWGSGPVRNDKKALATLEVSDQVRLEDGSVGHGIVFTRSIGGVSSKQFLAITEDGQLPYGQVKIRDAAAVVETADIVTMADIEIPDGSSVPISLRLE